MVLLKWQLIECLFCIYTKQVLSLCSSYVFGPLHKKTNNLQKVKAKVKISCDQRLCFRSIDCTILLPFKSVCIDLSGNPKYNSSSIYIQNFKILALFCACAARFVSDLVGNHIVGFPTRRLNFIRKICSDTNFDSTVYKWRNYKTM